MQAHAKTDQLKTPAEAKKYQAIKNRLFLFSIFLNLCFLILFIFTGWSKALSAKLFDFTANFFLHNALYFTVFSLIYSFLFFPLDYYEGYVLEHHFGLSRQSLRAWIQDILKKGGIAFFISLILLEAVYFFLLKTPLWWLWAAFFWFFISIVLARAFPKIILPLFFKSHPLEEGVLRNRIFSLLEKYSVALKEVYVLDFSKKTVKANAMVAGLGRTKQIYLSDTLLNEFTQSEIEVVLAHELGHYIHRDTSKLAVLSLALAFISFLSADFILHKFIYQLGFSSIADIAAFPFFLAVIMLASLAVLPLQNAYSRHLEKRADLFALDVTGAPLVFISMMKRLGEKNFADFSPSKIAEFFLYNHPPIAKRITMANAFLDAHKDKNV